AGFGQRRPHRLDRRREQHAPPNRSHFDLRVHVTPSRCATDWLRVRYDDVQPNGCIIQEERWHLTPPNRPHGRYPASPFRSTPPACISPGGCSTLASSSSAARSTTRWPTPSAPSCWSSTPSTPGET